MVAAEQNHSGGGRTAVDDAWNADEGRRRHNHLDDK